MLYKLSNSNYIILLRYTKKHYTNIFFKNLYLYIKYMLYLINYEDVFYILIKV